MRKVTIVNKWVSHYRRPFYEALREDLWQHDIQLNLIYGDPVATSDLQKKDWVDISWGLKVLNVGVGINRKLIWQPVYSYLRDSDLIIVEQANKLLLNYLLQARRPFVSQKLAFWGHGRNMQGNPISFGERLKKVLLRKVDWWFTYNDASAFSVEESGFPAQRITTVENAVDTEEIINQGNKILGSEINDFKVNNKITGEYVGVYCGAIYSIKEIPFLLEAAEKIRQKITDFELIVIGSGPEQSVVESYAKENTWVHYLGSLFGYEKNVAMKSAQLYLHPGALGLGVLDAFALSLPVITTYNDKHGPEFFYIEDGVNGIVTERNVNRFAEEVGNVFTQPDLLRRLTKGCEVSAKHYTIDNMVSNFSGGIIRCLNS